MQIIATHRKGISWCTDGFGVRPCKGDWIFAIIVTMGLKGAFLLYLIVEDVYPVLIKEFLLKLF